MAKSKANKTIKALYNDYSEHTQLYMNNIHATLTKKFGYVSEDWLAQLEILADLYETYWLATKQIREDGLLVKNRFDMEEIHKCYKVKLDALIQVNKIVASFGLSPLAVTKIKAIDEGEGDLIDNLLND